MQLKKAQEFIEKRAYKLSLSLKSAPLTVGFSGGADSTLALLIAKKLQDLDKNFKVTVVHCIHGLDADDPIWLSHCKKFCENLGVPLITPKLNIVYQNRISPEDSSRQERYRALLEVSGKQGYLVLGHQADDVIEGFLLALKRGSGPKGLANMQTLIKDERGTILRPLLDLHKTEIEEILKALGYDFVFDISNTYLKFERNFVRLKVLPLLRERFSGIDEAILRSAKLCALEHELAERYLEDYAYRYINESEGFLEVKNLNLNDEALLLSLIRKFLVTCTGLAPDFSQVKESLNLLQGSADQEGQINLGPYLIKRFRDKLYVLKESLAQESGTFSIKLPKDGEKFGEGLVLKDFSYQIERLNLSDAVEGAFNCDEESVTLDFNKKGSMRLKPYKRQHSRELKKLFAFYEIPLWQRQAVPLIEDDKAQVLALGALFSCEKLALNKPCFALKIFDLKNKRYLKENLI